MIKQPSVFEKRIQFQIVLKTILNTLYNININTSTDSALIVLFDFIFKTRLTLLKISLFYQPRASCIIFNVKRLQLS